MQDNIFSLLEKNKRKKRDKEVWKREERLVTSKKE